MYKDWTFLNNPELSFESLGQLKEHIISERQFELTTHPIEQIKINVEGPEEGTIQWNGEPMLMTQNAFKNFCRILGIPDPFARKIPVDLLSTNINRLETFNSGEEITLVHDKDGNVIGINKAPFVRQPIESIIDRFIETDLEPVFIHADYDKIAIATTDPKFGEIMADKGDPSKIGFVINGTDTTSKPLTARTGLYRMICSNGVIMGQDFGYIKIRFRGVEDYINRVNTFFNQLDSMELRMEEISNRLISMTKIKLTDREAFNIWKKINKYTQNPDLADSCLNIDEDQRVLLKSTIRARDMSLKRGTFRANNIDISDQPFGGTVYDTYNKITSRAKEFNLETRQKLEKVGGEIFELDCLEKDNK